MNILKITAALILASLCACQAQPTELTTRVGPGEPTAVTLIGADVRVTVENRGPGPLLVVFERDRGHNAMHLERSGDRAMASQVRRVWLKAEDWTGVSIRTHGADGLALGGHPQASEATRALLAQGGIGSGR